MSKTLRLAHEALATTPPTSSTNKRKALGDAEMEVDTLGEHQAWQQHQPSPTPDGDTWATWAPTWPQHKPKQARLHSDLHGDPGDAGHDDKEDKKESYDKVLKDGVDNDKMWRWEGYSQQFGPYQSDAGASEWTAGTPWLYNNWEKAAASSPGAYAEDGWNNGDNGRSSDGSASSQAAQEPPHPPHHHP
jgi:hypothetical protein